MRRAGTQALLVAVGVALCAGVLVSAALGERDGAARPGTLIVARMLFEAGQLVVWFPADLDHPALTRNSPYLELECYTAAGKHLLTWRRPWPELTGDHFHMLVPKRTARRADRCRVKGMTTVFKTEVVDGPKDGTHPKGPPVDPNAQLDPLRLL